jgi:hypothetical protein
VHKDLVKLSLIKDVHGRNHLTVVSEDNESKKIQEATTKMGPELAIEKLLTICVTNISLYGKFKNRQQECLEKNAFLNA